MNYRDTGVSKNILCPILILYKVLYGIILDALEAGQVKNVDGAARERKGSNKFAKKKQQSSRPGSGNRNSIGSFEEQEDDSGNYLDRDK